MNDNERERLVKSFDFLGRINRQRKLRLIRVDDRESRDRLTETLLTGLGYTVQRERLPLGDYQWESKLGLVIAERKTPRDAHDLPRLLRQLERLRDTPSILPILLIDWRYERESPWKDHDFDNLLVSIQGRVKVAHCLQGQLANRLDSLYKWSNRSSHTFLDASM